MREKREEKRIKEKRRQNDNRRENIDKALRTRQDEFEGKNNEIKTYCCDIDQILRSLIFYWIQTVLNPKQLLAD